MYVLTYQALTAIFVCELEFGSVVASPADSLPTAVCLKSRLLTEQSVGFPAGLLGSFLLATLRLVAPTS